jgi:malate dehydrogenase
MGSRSIVAIVGAGTLGGALAHTLAGRNRLDEIRLIDTSHGVAAGKALDIQQAGAVEGFRTRVVAQSDTSWAIGATVVVLAGPVVGAEGTEGHDEWDSDQGLGLLSRLAANDPRTVFVCAGASHAAFDEIGVAELGVPRVRLLGSAPVALESALRAIVAVELRSAASQVSISVLGRPPGRTVVLWSQATVCGHALGQLIEPARLARLRERVSRLWPPGPYTLASAAGRVSEALVDGNTGRILPCFVSLEGELGVSGRVAAMPVRLGACGLTRVIEPPLSVQERVQLDTALT